MLELSEEIEGKKELDISFVEDDGVSLFMAVNFSRCFMNHYQMTTVESLWKEKLDH